MIHRHNRCLGITVFRWGRRQIEIWFCPKGEVIEAHVHQFIDSTIILLLGGMWGDINGKIGYVGWRDIFRRFKVPAGVMHQATIKRFTIFMNWEKWASDVPVKSAAVDFTAV